MDTTSPKDIFQHFKVHFKRYVYARNTAILSKNEDDEGFLFLRLLSVKIVFVLKAINLQTVRHRELPDCYDFTVFVRGAIFLHPLANHSIVHEILSYVMRQFSDEYSIKMATNIFFNFW